MRSADILKSVLADKEARTHPLQQSGCTSYATSCGFVHKVHATLPRAVAAAMPAHAYRKPLRRCSGRVCAVDKGKRPRPSPGNDPRLKQEAASSSPEADLEVVQLQNADVEGVARVDDDFLAPPGRVQLLVAGDSAAFLLFAILGRINHGEVVDIELVATVLPFLLGWFSIAWLSGAYGKAAQDGEVVPAAKVAAITWAVSTPISLTLRGLIKGYPPPTPFIIVSFVVTGVLLIGWRSALAAVTTPVADLTPLEKFRRQKAKKGNAFEFMQLLTSLTKRW